jgi:hypothetical protein
MSVIIHDDQYRPENIEGVLIDIENREPEYKQYIKDNFLDKTIIKYYILDETKNCINDKDLQFVLKILIKYGYIPDGDLEIMAAELRSDDFIKYKRTSPWHFSDISVLDSGGEYVSHGYCKAIFHLANK